MLYICIYVNVYVYVYVYVYVCVYVYVYIIHIHTYIHTYARAGHVQRLHGFPKIHTFMKTVKKCAKFKTKHEIHYVYIYI